MLSDHLSLPHLSLLVLINNLNVNSHNNSCLYHGLPCVGSEPDYAKYIFPHFEIVGCLWAYCKCAYFVKSTEWSDRNQTKYQIKFKYTKYFCPRMWVQYKYICT